MTSLNFSTIFTDVPQGSILSIGDMRYLFQQYAVMPTYLHPKVINCLSPTSYPFTHISPLQAGSSKIYQPTLPKVVIKSIDIMTLNIFVTEVLNFAGMSYKRADWFTTKKQSSHTKSSHIVRLGNN